MSSIPVISFSTNSVRFLPFTWILLLVKYRFVVYAGCSCSCPRIVVWCTLCQNGKSNICANAVAILDECNLRSDEVQVETRCNLCDKTIDDENYDLCTSCNNTYHLTCMETNNDHKTCYSVSSSFFNFVSLFRSSLNLADMDSSSWLLDIELGSKIYHLTCMETNNDHKTCYSCKSYIDELETKMRAKSLFWRKPAVITIDVLTQYKHKRFSILTECTYIVYCCCYFYCWYMFRIKLFAFVVYSMFAYRSVCATCLTTTIRKHATRVNHI
jgi:hypothetical protein